MRNLVVRRMIFRSERMNSEDGPRVDSAPLLMPPEGGIFIRWAGVLATPSALARALYAWSAAASLNVWKGNLLQFSNR